MNVRFYRKPALAGIFLAAGVVWVTCFHFYLVTRYGFLDDAYIYLHIAGNILEAGSARYFPVSDLGALVASSPLRLLVVVPSLLVARWFVEPMRSFQCASLALALSGLVSSIIYLPFFRRAPVWWLGGLFFGGLIALSTESGLQMEGLLLFWSAFAILYTLHAREVDFGFFRRLGILAALLVLTRPEYGLPVCLVLFVYASAQQQRGFTLAYTVPVLAAGAVWVVIAAALGVYPIPTSWLTKVLVGEIGFTTAGSFTDQTLARMRGLFFDSRGVPGLWVYLYFAAVVGTVASRSVVLSWAAACLVASYLLITPASGTYLWYHENLAIVLVTMCFYSVLKYLPFTNTTGVLKRTTRIWNAGRLVVAAVCVLMFFYSSIFTNRLFTWSFRVEKSRGLAYREIARSSDGYGRFSFADTISCYLVMSEVGIPAFLGGNKTWIMDRTGLVQPGALQEIDDHFLSAFYPKSVLRSPEEELNEILRKYEKTHGTTPVKAYLARGNPGEEDIGRLCTIYFPDTGVCLEDHGSFVVKYGSGAPRGR